MLRELIACGFYLDLVGPSGARSRDPFPFFSGKLYLMRRLGLRDRMCAYLRHREFERRHRGPSYFEQIYGGGGIKLWRHDEAGALLLLSLERSEERDRNEGELSVVLRVDGDVCCRVSFCYVQADLFMANDDQDRVDEPTGSVAMLISRSQTLSGPGQDRFVEVLPNESARMYTLAGLSGVAVADGFRRVRGVHETEQIGYQPALTDGFRRSYSRIWYAFSDTVGAHDHVSFDAEFPPTANRPINAKNRSRARRRRRNWDAVRAAARRSVEDFSIRVPGLRTDVRADVDRRVG